jgi:hypothetical protein
VRTFLNALFQPEQSVYFYVQREGLKWLFTWGLHHELTWGRVEGFPAPRIATFVLGVLLGKSGLWAG